MPMATTGAQKMLNKISESGAKKLVAMAEKALARRLSEPIPETESEREKFREVVAESSFDLGTSLYRLGTDPGLVREALARAAIHSVGLISERGAPEPGEYRSPYEFDQALCLAVCFGPPELRSSLAGIQEWQFWTGESDNRIYALYLKTAKNFAAGLPLDEKALLDVESLCESDTASKRTRMFVRPAARGLRSAVDGTEDLWNSAISDLVSAHRDEALHGDLRLLPDGFIALPALMIAKLGLENGLSCTVSSPYLPLMLLQPEKGR